MAPRLKILFDDDAPRLRCFIDSNMAQLMDNDDNASTMPTEQIIFDDNDNNNDNNNNNDNIVVDDDTISLEYQDSPAPLYIMIAPLFNGREQWLQQNNIKYVLQGDEKIKFSRSFPLCVWLDVFMIPHVYPELASMSEYEEQLLVILRLSGRISKECFKTKMDELMKKSFYYSTNPEYSAESSQQCFPNLVACVEEIIEEAAEENGSLPILPRNIYFTSYEDSTRALTHDVKCKQLQYDEDDLAVVSYDDDQPLPDVSEPLTFGLFYGSWDPRYILTVLEIAERESRPVYVVVDKMRTKPSGNWNGMQCDFDISGDSMCTTKIIHNMLNSFMRTGKYVGTKQIIDVVYGQHIFLAYSFGFYPGGDTSCEERDLNNCVCASLGYSRNNHDGTIVRVRPKPSATEAAESQEEIELQSESGLGSVLSLEADIQVPTVPEPTTYSGHTHVLDDYDGDIEERPLKRRCGKGSDESVIEMNSE